jgi:phosphopantetheine adenylyltransferase
MNNDANVKTIYLIQTNQWSWLTSDAMRALWTYVSMIIGIVSAGIFCAV